MLHAPLDKPEACIVVEEGDGCHMTNDLRYEGGGAVPRRKYNTWDGN